MQSKGKERSKQAGFTLLEVLTVVAIIGLLASMAVPLIKQHITRTKFNAAVTELKLFRDAMLRFAADKGQYPTWGHLHRRNLRPLSPEYIPLPLKITHHLAGDRLDLYVPFNFIEIDEHDELFGFGRSSSFVALATLAYEPSIRFFVTDGTIYFTDNGGHLKRISDF